MTEQDLPWPDGSSIRGVAFVPPAAGRSPLMDLPAPVARQAVPVSPGTAADLEVLTIPQGSLESPELSQQMKEWTSPVAGDAGYHLIVLHGAQLHWRSPRLAIIAPAERLESLARAAIEAAYLESELNAVENGLAEIWPQVEADAPLAFEFRARDMTHREQLGQRFQKLVMLRSRMSRIMPRLLVPPAYPPTLASQVGERFRERLGVSYRLEALDTQFELFERVYDGCSERASDFVLARKGHTLEWIIILLLALQTALSIFDLLNGLTP